MQNAIIKAQIGLSRCEQNLQQLFMLVHLFGHEDEGGLDNLTLASIRNIIDAMKHEFKLARQLLDSSLGLDDRPSPHTAVITELRPALNQAS